MSSHASSNANAVADISVPNQYLASVKIEMVSIHASTQLGFVPSVLKQTAVTPQALLKAMKLKLDIANDKTRQADPATLSRLSRTSRSYTDRVVELARAQLATSHPSTLSFVAGGCKHPGLTGFERDRADGSLHAIVKQLDTTQPRFMLMLGDQIYADVRAGVMDTQSPAEKLLPSLRNAFGESMGFRRLARRLPMYMVIDDHEIHDDWSQEQTLGSYANEILARNAEEAFGIFQYAHSPGFPKDVTVAPGAKAIRVEGFNYCYEQNGIPFLVLDTRTQRKRVPTRQLLDASQWLWLEQWLIAEQAKGSHPKFVVSGSVVVPGLQKNAGLPAPRDADSWQLSPVERSRLLSFIADKNIDNVVFLSSDYHCSAAATITFTHSKVKAWAIVAPPLHAPMRFANVQPNEVDRHEAVCLARGRAIVQSQAWNGEGWLNCQIKRVSKTRHELELTFNVRQLEEESWTAPMGPIKWRL